uniref:Uncharacterized protein n=1 Tax=Rhizophora mucronata TaxID=61149 RepID=A0A2P2LBS3_RHIMU
MNVSGMVRLGCVDLQIVNNQGNPFVASTVQSAHFLTSQSNQSTAKWLYSPEGERRSPIARSQTIRDAVTLARIFDPSD